MRLLPLILAAALAGGASLATAADVSISVGGEISPGVYGRIDIGNRTPPPVVYTQPVLVTPPPRGVVVGAPIYLNVPPGHAKHWSKHCAAYNACGQRVYFVKSAEYDPGYKPGRGPGDQGNQGGGPGNGHGRGKGKD